MSRLCSLFAYKYARSHLLYMQNRFLLADIHLCIKLVCSADESETHTAVCVTHGIRHPPPPPAGHSGAVEACIFTKEEEKRWLPV